MTFYLFVSESFFNSSDESQAGRRLRCMGPMDGLRNQPREIDARRVTKLPCLRGPAGRKMAYCYE